MSEARAMIRCDKLSKHYGPTKAVDGISFEVRSGEVLGFLGPNGAGKSTTMKMLTCFLAPTGGRAEVAGLDITEHSLEVRRKIGYLPEDTPLYRDMTVLEYLDFVADVRAIPRGERRSRIKRIGEVTGVLNVLGKPIGQLSRGYRQRVGLTQAMIHDPEILVLDEPTVGLDPNQIVEIRQLIQELGKEKTIILSTHILPEVQATCSRVVIIAEGRLVADGRPEDLVARQQSDQYRLVVEAGTGGATLDAVRERLRALAGVRAVVEEPGETGTLRFTVGGDGTDLRSALAGCVIDAGWRPLEIHRREASLEEVFGRLTRGSAPAPARGKAA